jgi:membrane-bound inhibitor of C-type lysozyme
MTYTVSVSSGVATITLTKTAGVTSSSVATLINGMSYSNTSQDPTVGTRTATLTQIVDSGVNTGGNVNTTTLSIASAISVVPVDDAPTVSATGSNPTFTEDGSAVALFSGANVSAIEAAQNIKSLTFTVNNVTDGAAERITVDGSTINLVNGSGTTTTNGLSYSVSVSSGVATITLTKTAGVASSSVATLINGISYSNTSQDPTVGTRTATLTQIVDSGVSTGGNVNTTTLSIASAISVVPVDDAPTVSATGINPTFTEDGSAVSLFSGAAVSAIEAAQNIKSLTFTINNLTDGSAERVTVDGSTFSLTNGATGTTTTNGMTYTVSVSSGVATITLTKTAGVASSSVATLINGISYSNTSQDPTVGTRTATLTQIVDSGVNTGGNVNTTTLSIASAISVVPVDDAPTVSASGTNPTFTEDGSAVALFSGANVSAIEAAQNIKSLTFTVNNLTDGSAERITVDGSTFSLTNGATGTTTTNGMTYNVSVSSGVATITLTKTAGVASSSVATLINGMTYSNTSQDPTVGTRTATLTQIVDSGASTGANVNTTTLSIASAISVVPVDDAPTVSATASNPTFTEDGSAVALFSGANVSAIEAAQNIKSLTFTVNNLTDGSAERITIDGSTFSLTNGATGNNHCKRHDLHCVCLQWCCNDNIIEDCRCCI